MAQNLGHVTAYAYAKSQGYTGTEEEFAIEIAHSASNAQIARLNALKAEGFAVGTQDGDPSETYEENNAEYFKNLAAGSAGSAASSASVASQKADSASADALKAEGYALGTQNGASVPSGSPYFEHNAFYFAALAGASAATAVTKAGEAYQSAVAALGSASVATQMASTASNKATAANTSALKAEGFAVGEQNGVPVESGDYFENNAAYYASVAASAAASAASSAESVDVHKDGTYEDMTVGNAFEVLSDRGDTDKVPYVFRKTGGAKKAYNREMLKKIVGGTVAWNQLVYFTASSSEVFGITRTAVTVDGKPGVHYIGTCTDTINFTAFSTNEHIVDGHKYFVSLGATIPTGCQINTSIIDRTNEGIAITNNGYVSFGVTIQAGTTVDFIVYPQTFDLTQMFGSTIADAIYSMEQATAGSGVAFFRLLFPNSYYAYDAGTLMSVQAKEHRTVGFNQWDEQWERGTVNWSTGIFTPSPTGTRIISKNYIPVLSGKDYYTKERNDKVIYGYTEIGADKGVEITINPVNNIFTIPNGIKYIKFGVDINAYGSTTYKNDICINLFDSSKNGTYESYEERVYPLDSDLVLRGIPKLDSDGNLYYDGDEYTPDGTVTRKYGIVDLGTLSWQTANEYGQTNSVAISDAVSPSSSTQVYGVLCAKYKSTSARSWYNHNTDELIAITGAGYGTSRGIGIVDSALSNLSFDQVRTALSGVYVIYELATPTTESADPYHEIQICNRYGTEEFVDAGVTASTPTRDVSIPVGHESFLPVNVFDYIEELTNPDHDMIADSLIPSGKYFMVGNSLYYSTSQIQAGATINPGTNCTAISLAEALNTINQ